MDTSATDLIVVMLYFSVNSTLRPAISALVAKISLSDRATTTKPRKVVESKGKLRFLVCRMVSIYINGIAMP